MESASPVVSRTEGPLVRPRLRGVFHAWAFAVSVPVGVALVIAMPSPRAAAGMAIYASAISALFGVSALYHRVMWVPARRRWMRRADRTMIFVVIAAIYTSWSVLGVQGPLGSVLVPLAWAAVLGGVALNMLWVDHSHRWLTTAAYAPLGLIAVALLPQLGQRAGSAVILLVIAAGIFSAAGGVAYALKRPDPLPAVFGYHEIFHILVIAAATALYLAVAIAALRVS